ncbi:MAG: class I SAM-dependent methyltransferase [Azoarcus sp.]|jgi:SAM-dependent methyltransferase|nr:class I SAM-dependent methyltransferase [Azoarcus sp.]
MLSKAVKDAWAAWIKVTRERCHLHFEIEGNDLKSHVTAGHRTGLHCASRVKNDIANVVPEKILEIGCSVGFNCLGLAERYPQALITGIEPDGEACVVASSMADYFGLKNVRFIQGIGESLPFPDESYDLIVCHTVIEHVNDVETCIKEMARILRAGGVAHIEAPNYIWPWEPHLGIAMPPLCPKPIMRFLAKLQGASAHVTYAEHLKLVHPAWIERCFLACGLKWTNRVEAKFQNASEGNNTDIVAYGRLAKIFKILHAMKLSGLAIYILLRLRLYPSLLYTAYKQPGAEKSLWNYTCDST